MSTETEQIPAATSLGGDPAALGLAGFAFTTLVLSFGESGIIKESGAIAIVFGLAIFYGGLGQLVAGILEFRRGNTFGGTAFFSFGAFWLSFWWLNTHPAGGDIHEAIGLYLILWAVFTAFMSLAALKTSTITLSVFVALTLTFLFLALGAWQNSATNTASLTKVGGYLGILTGILALYNAAAVVVNATHKRDFLPTWPR